MLSYSKIKLTKKNNNNNNINENDFATDLVG